VATSLAKFQTPRSLRFKSKIRGLSLPLKVRRIKGVISITPLGEHSAPRVLAEPLLILRGGILKKFGEIQMLKYQNYSVLSLGF